jgi:membrane protein DedA with SNARE-associated domain
MRRICGCEHSLVTIRSRVEQLIQELSQLNPFWVYLAVAGIAYIENVLPPFPSDVIVVAAGSLVGVGLVDFSLLLLLATVGSTLGFITMYEIGDWFGDKILETGKIKFIPVESVKKVEEWFRQYGYWIIVANRFLAGTRAVVSFFAGIAELSLLRTTALSFVSALIWNCLLLFAGKKLGENWQDIMYYLEAYSKGVTSILAIVVVVYIARLLYKRRASQKTSSDQTHR